MNDLHHFDTGTPSYRILGSEDSIIWQRTNGRHKFEIRATLPVTAGVSATPQVIRPDGSVQPTPPVQSLQAKAFRYYRFASSAEDLFEAYRYLFLSFESALYDLHPKPTGQREGEWLKAALRQAKAKYSLNLSAFSTSGADEVEEFYQAHYRAVRCATFHAQSNTLLPGSPSDVKEVHDQLRIFQPIVTQLLKAHFNARFATSGMTSYAMNRLLEASTPLLHLLRSLVLPAHPSEPPWMNPTGRLCRRKVISSRQFTGFKSWIASAVYSTI
jgi:hypothetical protein